MPSGGARKGAGRKPSPIKKKKYSTRLRPDLIRWLLTRKNAVSDIEAALDFYIESIKPF